MKTESGGVVGRLLVLLPGAKEKGMLRFRFSSDVKLLLGTWAYGHWGTSAEAVCSQGFGKHKAIT